MTPGTYILRLRRGDYFRKKFRFQDPETLEYIDFTGMTGIAQVRAEEDAIVVMAEAVVTVGTDATSPYVQVYFPSTETDDLTAVEAVWDLQITDATGPLTWLEGPVVIKLDTSRVA